MKDEKRISRRQLLRDAAGAATLASVGGISACFPDVGGEWISVDPLCTDTGDGGLETEAGSGANASQSASLSTSEDAGRPTSTVVEIYRADSMVDAATGTGSAKKGVVQPDKVQLMLDAALSELAGGADNPWPVLLPDYRPGMRIGLKVNCLNAYLPTSPALVLAIVTSLKSRLGVDPSNIIVWDRRLDELSRNLGYTSAELGGAQLLGTVNSVEDPSGPGYTKKPLCGVVAGQVPRLSRIHTELTDITINCPVLKTHGVSGVTAALKNIYGIIDIPGNYHGALLQTALPQLYALPLIGKRIRLTIVDALTAVLKGDTSDRPNGYPRRILAATDPVAMDAYALALVNQLRSELGYSTPVDEKLTKWIANAESLGIGSANYTLSRLS